MNIHTAIQPRMSPAAMQEVRIIEAEAEIKRLRAQLVEKESPVHGDNDTVADEDAAYWGQVRTSVAAVMAADSKRRGSTPLALPAPDDDAYAYAYELRVAESVAAIIRIDRECRGEIQPTVSLPSQARQPQFSGQDVDDPEYWKFINRASAAILKVHYECSGRKLED